MLAVLCTNRHSSDGQPHLRASWVESLGNKTAPRRLPNSARRPERYLSHAHLMHIWPTEPPNPLGSDALDQIVYRCPNFGCRDDGDAPALPCEEFRGAAAIPVPAPVMKATCRRVLAYVESSLLNLGQESCRRAASLTRPPRPCGRVGSLLPRDAGPEPRDRLRIDQPREVADLVPDPYRPSRRGA